MQENIHVKQYENELLDVKTRFAHKETDTKVLKDDV